MGGALEPERLRSEPSDLKSTATFFGNIFRACACLVKGVSQKRKLAYLNKNGDLIIDMNATCCINLYILGTCFLLQPLPSSLWFLFQSIYVLEHEGAYLGRWRWQGHWGTENQGQDPSSMESERRIYSTWKQHAPGASTLQAFIRRDFVLTRTQQVLSGLMLCVFLAALDQVIVLFFYFFEPLKNNNGRPSWRRLFQLLSANWVAGVSIAG